MKAAVALAKKGYKAVLQVKTGHGLFPKKFIESALEDAPGGVWIVLEATHEGVPLIALGYRYSTRTTLHFVATKDAGSTAKGTPYQMNFTDDWGNVHIRDVERPDIISQFFENSNTIDKHKSWLLRNGGKLRIFSSTCLPPSSDSMRLIVIYLLIITKSSITGYQTKSIR